MELNSLRSTLRQSAVGVLEMLGVCVGTLWCYVRSSTMKMSNQLQKATSQSCLSWHLEMFDCRSVLSLLLLLNALCDSSPRLEVYLGGFGESCDREGVFYLL